MMVDSKKWIFWVVYKVIIQKYFNYLFLEERYKLKANPPMQIPKIRIMNNKASVDIVFSFHFFC